MKQVGECLFSKSFFFVPTFWEDDKSQYEMKMNGSCSFDKEREMF